MVWYQMFEYAIGHWMQKATEHVIGCVLCSPGCFSLFRGEALMDDAVMNKYTTMSSEAKHFVQYDQGNYSVLISLSLSLSLYIYIYIYIYICVCVCVCVSASVFLG